MMSPSSAQHLITMFETGDLSTAALAGYDRLLRERFQWLFIFCNWTHDLLVNPLLLNSLVKTALMPVVLAHEINSDSVQNASNLSFSLRLRR